MATPAPTGITMATHLPHNLTTQITATMTTMATIFAYKL
jgi:hypothetical protein